VLVVKSSLMSNNRKKPFMDKELAQH
jgi:hypothetical protein